MSEKPIANMRRLKRIPSDEGLVYTLETQAEQRKDNLLCNYCGNKLPVVGFPGCPKYKELSGHQERGIGMMVRTCTIYQPLLTFRPPLGQYGKEFNTFRLGSAWYNRVSKGTTVALFNTESEEIFAKAEVTALYHGDLEEMCEEHASRNHLFIGDKKGNVAERMEKAIRQAYGHIIRSNHVPCSVIYLRNLDGKRKARTSKG